MQRTLWGGILVSLLLARLSNGQPKPADAGKKEIEEGIAVTSDLVRKACGACHPSDDKGRMSRISYRRTTPEGWQLTVRRMASLNGVKLEPNDAREIVQYLSTHHGLAPDEVRPGAFEVEKRIIDYKYTDADTEQTCIKCHSFGRVLHQRRSKMEWELLLAMHRGYYPLVDFQAYRRMGPAQTQPGPDGRPPDNRHPMEKALAHLTTAFPLNTPEWSAWSANMPAQPFQGRWALSGYETGKGPVYGEVTIDAGLATRIRFTYARTGEQVERQGKGIVYTGFQWRGRSMVGGREDTSLREVVALERNQREANGRWFTGAYDETGIDVHLRRVGNDPWIAGVNVPALRRGARDVRVTIHGFNLPAQGSISLGAGVTARIEQAAAGRASALVSVDEKAPIGYRDLLYGGASKQAALAVYDKIDSLKVRPRWAMARVGGLRFPKGYQQFEAIGISNGADGKPDTRDDLELGMVDVAWSMEEYTATYVDDDREFVGSLDANGRFTPAGDGPNAGRSGNRNNIGDVWIVAAHKESGKRGRAHLLVAPPVYMRFDMPGVIQ